MKILKNLFAFALPVLAMVAMSSCSEEEASYSAAKVPTGAQVFFHSSNAGTINLASDAASFEVLVARQDTTEALSVPLSLVCDSTVEGLFTAPETVEFAAGAAQATVEVAYDAAAVLETLGYANFKTIVLSLVDAENLTAYGITNLEMSVGFPEPWSEWEEFGTGLYTLSGYWSGTHSGLPVYYREYLLNDKDAQFYIPGVANAMNITIDYDRTTGNCAVKVQQATTSDKYGPVFVSDMPNYPLQAGLSYDDYPCTFNAETGTFSLTLVYFVSAELGSSASGYFAAGVVETIQLDGYELPDATVKMEYLGVFANTIGQSSAVLNVTLGADADSARVAMVENIDNETLAKLIAGEVEYQTLEESGYAAFPVEASGRYNVLAITYMGGEPAEYGTAKFDAVVGGGATETITAEDYEGEWVFENTYKGKVYEAVGNISAVEGEDGVTYLLCQGFADAASIGYTSDEFLLVFDAETGLVTLPTPQQCADFSYQGADYPVLVVLSNSEEMTVFSGSVVGKLVGDNIVFVNAEDNKYEADSFVFYSEELGLISYFNALEWRRNTESEGVKASAKPFEFYNVNYLKETESFVVNSELIQE